MREQAPTREQSRQEEKIERKPQVITMLADLISSPESMFGKLIRGILKNFF